MIFKASVGAQFTITVLICSLTHLLITFPLIAAEVVSSTLGSIVQLRIETDVNSIHCGANMGYDAQFTDQCSVGKGAGSEKETRDTSIILVDQDGYGDYTTVQAAVDAVPDNNSARITIRINEGTFLEKVRVTERKRYVTLLGAGREATTISWHDNVNSTGHLEESASVAVYADNFIANFITFKNTAPRPSPEIVGAQAVAFLISGDMAAFYGCGFYGAQDTLYDKSGRHYFQDCYIEGEIDFIFGNGRSLYEQCLINSTALTTGYITAQKREYESENTGYSFVECTIEGTGSNVLLGRAWGPSARVVYSSSYLPDIIAPRGWSDWDNSSADLTIFYAEYNNRGPGADMRQRVTYAKALTEAEAQPFVELSFIDGKDWLTT